MYAADNGHLDILKWARAQNPPCPEEYDSDFDFDDEDDSDLSDSVLDELTQQWHMNSWSL